MPRLGGKKSYHILMDDLKSMKIGRDKLFDILRANHLLIQPKRRYHVTTNSHHDLENIKTKFLIRNK
jgi:phage antirepressor YoqD-like protein